MMDSFETRLSTCRKCGLRDGCKAPVPGQGSDDTKVVLVGEAPGRNEDEQGVPFCGYAGKYLNVALEYVGLSRDEVYVTNVVKCRPPGNRDPKTEEIDECKRWLWEELMRLKPEVIVTLGRFAAEQMLGRKVAIMKDRGKTEPKWLVIDEDRLGVTVFPMLHPAWFLRGDRKKNMVKYKQDLRKLRMLLKGRGLVEEKEE